MIQKEAMEVSAIPENISNSSLNLFIKMIALKIKNSLLVFLTMLLCVCLFSCRSAKKIQSAISKKDTVAAVIVNQSNADSILQIKNTMATLKGKYIDFKTFSAKIKVEYEDSRGKQPNVTAYVHMIKDSVIWMSMYATFLNIEAFRVLITKDSVFLLDKLNKQVQFRSLDYLQDVTGIPFDFKTLQDLLVGNPVFLDSNNIVYYKQTSNKILLATVGKYFKHLLTLSDNKDTLLLHSKLDDIDINRNRTADLTYDDYENTVGFNFSTYREITVSEKNKLDIRLNFKQYEFNKDLSVPFNIPKNYERK
jgi:hypothetical protein